MNTLKRLVEKKPEMSYPYIVGRIKNIVELPICDETKVTVIKELLFTFERELDRRASLEGEKHCANNRG